MLQDVAALLEERVTVRNAEGETAGLDMSGADIPEGLPVQTVCSRIRIHRQKTNMTEAEREAFLEQFSEESEDTHIGLCVLGGIFGEGIDLKGERLIGAVIIGTGLPQVCRERELFRRYYDEKAENSGNDGFSGAYLYPGMNKVQQAAGRVIRTMEDKGAILLLGDRFAGAQYSQ